MNGLPWPQLPLGQFTYWLDESVPSVPQLFLTHPDRWTVCFLLSLYMRMPEKRALADNLKVHGLFPNDAQMVAFKQACATWRLPVGGFLV